MGVESQIGLGAGWRNDELHPTQVNFTEQCNLSAPDLVPALDSVVVVSLCRQKKAEEILMPNSFSLWAGTYAADHLRVVAWTSFECLASLSSNPDLVLLRKLPAGDDNKWW